MQFARENPFADVPMIFPMGAPIARTRREILQMLTIARWDRQLSKQQGREGRWCAGALPVVRCGRSAETYG
jgi:hypothetical protein